MTDEAARYGDGRLKASQDRADKRFRERQKRLRAWSEDLAELLGKKDRYELIETPATELVASILRREADQQ